MKRSFHRNFARGFMAFGLAATGIGITRPAVSEPIHEQLLLSVPVSFGSATVPALTTDWETDLSRGQFETTGFQIEEARQQSELPESTRFSGLAGALSLAIDDSGERPRVNGISLAPRETLQIRAGSGIRLRGIQGQISIRLDF